MCIVTKFHDLKQERIKTFHRLNQCLYTYPRPISNLRGSFKLITFTTENSLILQKSSE